MSLAEKEVENLNEAVHRQFEEEMVSARETMTEVGCFLLGR